MKNTKMLTLFTTLVITANNVFAITTVPSEFPSGVCSPITGQMCEMHDNIVTSVPEVLSLEECRRICHNEFNCSFLTYFGSDSNPISDVCVLFSSCDILDECHDCITEESSCLTLFNGLCSAPFESHVGANLMQIVSDFENEYDCKDRCTQTVGCKFYTYHNQSDPSFPGTCFLLYSLLNPILPCENCMTGSANCYNTGECFFTMEDGSTTNGMLITKTSAPTVLIPVALGLCELTLVAVGGGEGGGYSGGGSGYIEWIKLNMTGTIQLEVTVGNGRTESVVTKDGEVIVVAKPGASPSDYVGGGGYSGGGGHDHGDGGSNGGNGGDGRYGAGGKGSNVNVAGIPLKSFVITPGVGGKHSSNHGGGGGGLLVDGKGPDGGTQYDGEGYGGGSGYSNNPLPGVVIVSFN